MSRSGMRDRARGRDADDARVEPHSDGKSDKRKGAVTTAPTLGTPTGFLDQRLYDRFERFPIAGDARTGRSEEATQSSHAPFQHS